MGQATSLRENQCVLAAAGLARLGIFLYPLDRPCLLGSFRTGWAEPLEASRASWVSSTSQASSEPQYWYYFCN